MEKLKQYLAGRKRGDFARDCGISEAFLSQIVSGKRRPRYDLMLVIEKVTGGKVGLYDWRNDG